MYPPSGLDLGAQANVGSDFQITTFNRGGSWMVGLNLNLGLYPGQFADGFWWPGMYPGASNGSWRYEYANYTSGNDWSGLWFGGGLFGFFTPGGWDNWAWGDGGWGWSGWNGGAYGYSHGAWFDGFGNFFWPGQDFQGRDTHGIDANPNVQLAQQQSRLEALENAAIAGQTQLQSTKNLTPADIDTETGSASLITAGGAKVFEVSEPSNSTVMHDGIQVGLELDGDGGVTENIQDSAVEGFQSDRFRQVANEGAQTPDSIEELEDEVNGTPNAKQVQPPTAPAQDQKQVSADKISEQTVLQMAGEGLVTFVDAPVGLIVDGKVSQLKDHRAFALVADVVGNRIKILILQRYDAPDGTFYRVVWDNGEGAEMEENATIEQMAGHLAYYRSKQTAQAFVDVKVINPATVAAMREAASFSNIGKELLLNLIPGRATIQHIKHGEPGEAAISLVGDVAMFLALPLRLFVAAGRTAAAIRGATEVAQGLAQASRTIQISAIALEGAVGTVRLGQAYALIKNDDGAPNRTGRIAGYLGEAILRLFSVAVQVKTLTPVAKGEVGWVPEPRHSDPVVRAYEESAPGTRPIGANGEKEVPSLILTDETGAKRPVKFDGIDGTVLIDRKRSIYTSDKAKGQALKQSEVLAQNGYKGMWEVPNETEARRAVKLFEELNIFNIEVRVVP